MGKKSKKAKDGLDDKVKEKKAKRSEPQLESRPNPIDPSLRYQMIETAAYYIAEKHGFDPRKSVEDWAQAEQEIDTMLDEEEQNR
ncbi:MAG: hypothetical protein B6D76_06760 [gamma proteobacterium symbiont of Stewartia floridana]|nr:MAG: hypothetical protein B6D76_06760 [gamma proteobacterium symbiont of Stewartia floridana]RLW60927.1 MAG: hypothetical protein B6D75_04430 [gamma proteobacterium symbiont of Stewartia floridana]